MTLKATQITNPPNVVPFSILFFIGPIHWLPRDRLTELNGFQHRTIAEPAAAHIVDFSISRILEKRMERPHEIGAVNIVSNLFPFVAVHRVGIPGRRALHQVGQETVELRTRVIRPGQASATETDRFHPEVSAVFLDE